MKTLELTGDGTLVAPFAECSPTRSALHYTADMLQRTTASTVGSERVGYPVVERIAGNMRNRYIASLLGRTKRALVNRFDKAPIAAAIAISMRSLSDLTRRF